MTVPTTGQIRSKSEYPLGLVFGAALALTGCPRTELGEGADAGAIEARTVDQVTDRVDDYLGERITVRGTMEKVRSPRSFVLEDHDWLFKEELLVIAPDQPVTVPAAAGNLEGSKVTATGTLRRMVVSDVEREYNLDLEPEFELEVRNRPVLVADELRPDPTAGVATERAGEVTEVLVLVPIPGPDELVGGRARLSEVEIRSRAGEQGFWVGPSHSAQVFVRVDDGVAAAGADTLGPQDRVTVVGTVKRVPDRATVENQWGLDSAQAAIVARQEALYVEADSISSPRS